MVASRRTKEPPSCRDLAFASHPSEQELITSFLRPRVVSGDKSSCKFIHDADVYSAHPAQLTREHASALTSDGEEVWYFFTTMRAKGGGRKARTVDTGEGCWHSEAGAKPVVDARRRRGGHLGHRQSFSFVTKEDGRRVRSGWLMVELGLDDDGQDELTLCKVYFSPRARKNNQKQPAATSSSGRKRKATDSNPDAPARQRRRRRRARLTSPEAAESSHSETDDDDDDDDETTGKPEGLREEKPAAVDGEADEPMSFSSLLWNNKDIMRELPGIGEADDQLTMDDALSNFSWLLWNEQDRMCELLNMSEEEFERAHPAPAAEFWHAELPPVPEIRLYGPDDWPLVGSPPVVRDKDAAVCTWMTLDEMYDHPDAKEILSPMHRLEEMRSSVEKNQ